MGRSIPDSKMVMSLTHSQTSLIDNPSGYSMDNSSDNPTLLDWGDALAAPVPLRQHRITKVSTHAATGKNISLE